MGLFNKKILKVNRERFTFVFLIADFRTQECYKLYFQFSLVDPWWIPKYDPSFGRHEIPLWGWLFFYFGRKTRGVIVPASPGEEPTVKPPIYDRHGCPWEMYGLDDRQMAKDFRGTIKKYKAKVSVEAIGEERTVFVTCGRHRIFGI